MATEPYKHTHDIDLDGTLDYGKISDLLGVVIARTVAAFERVQPVSDLASEFIVRHSNLFRSTHQSIGLLIRISDQDHLLYGDALSLAREQVEKVFVVSPLLDDPDWWASVYQAYGWKKLYEEHLLHVYECEDLPRFDEFHDTLGPEQFEKMRLALGLTPLNVEATKDRFENDCFGKSDPLPPHLAGHTIPNFPTPGTAWSQPGDDEIKAFLHRWYLQWKYLCDYSHVGEDKIAMTVLLGRDSPYGEEKKPIYIERRVHAAGVISLVAAASACTEVGRHCFAQDPDLVAALAEFWAILERRALLGQLFWEHRAKHLLPGVIGLG